MKANKCNLMCDECGDSFVRRKDRILDGNNFCCPACRRTWITKNRERKCAECDETFVPRKYQLDKGQGIFCSISCSVTHLHALPRHKEWRENISKGQKGRKGRRGQTHPCWKGGRYRESSGYVKVLVTPEKYTREHRLVMEQHLGRKLKSDEIVHHINEIKHDNALSNLTIVDRSEHAKLHNRQRNHTGQFCGIFETQEFLISEGLIEVQGYRGRIYDHNH